MISNQLPNVQQQRESSSVQRVSSIVYRVSRLVLSNSCSSCSSSSILIFFFCVLYSLTCSCFKCCSSFTSVVQRSKTCEASPSTRDAAVRRPCAGARDASDECDRMKLIIINFNTNISIKTSIYVYKYIYIPYLIACQLIRVTICL